MSKALSVGLGVPSSSGTYSAALEGLTGVNEVLMRRDPSIPPLYASGARWELKPDDPSDTRWRYANEVATDGWGDCQALAAYRAAELRVNGTDPAAHVRVYPTGKNKYHAVVARGDGSVEDPSVALGMMPFPGAPMTHDQLPAVQGPAGGSPGGGSPGLDPDAIQGAKHRIARSIAGLHPYAAVAGVGCFGDETGMAPKVARVKDAAPEFSQSTIHITPHKRGSVQGWKAVHRVPLKDGTAIVGMTKTYRNPTDCVGDAAGLISDVASEIAKAPAMLALLSPFSAATTIALQDPSVRHALGAVGRSVKNAAKQTKKTSNGGNASNGDGWPSDWGTVSGGPDNTDMAIVGWGLSNLTHLITDPLHAAGNLLSHPSLSNLGRLAISPLMGTIHSAGFGGGGGGSAVVNPGAIGRGGPIPISATVRANRGSVPAQTQPGFDPSMYPGMGYPSGMNPASGQYVPPGYNPATYPTYQQPQYPTQAAWNAPTAADFGLPVGLPGGGMPGESADLSVAFSDPSSMTALQSYSDPFGATGYWNS